MRIRFTRRRVLIGITILLFLVVGLIALAWRQDVGARASPLPSSIPSDGFAVLVAPIQRRDESGIEQVWVPAGWYRRGADPWRDFWNAREDETPQHDVHISRGFWLDKYEVSNEAYAVFVADGGYERRENWSFEGWNWKAGRTKPATLAEPGFDAADQPRCWITWYEAEAYARWRGGRLPTEAEWEYAARGPASTVYPWGDRWETARAHTNEAGVWHTRPIGSFPNGTSWCGAHDLSGNVHEWTADFWDPLAYRTAVQDDPRGPESGSLRTLRGGSFGGPPATSRSTRRMFRDPAQPSYSIGIRVVTDGEPPAGWRN